MVSWNRRMLNGFLFLFDECGDLSQQLTRYTNSNIDCTFAGYQLVKNASHIMFHGVLTFTPLRFYFCFIFVVLRVQMYWFCFYLCFWWHNFCFYFILSISVFIFSIFIKILLVYNYIFLCTDRSVCLWLYLFVYNNTFIFMITTFHLYVMINRQTCL